MKNRIIELLKNVTDLSTGEITKALNVQPADPTIAVAVVTRGTVAKCLTRMVKDNTVLRTPQGKYRLPTITISPA